MPWLGVVAGMYGLSWILENAVGILFALATHTTLTRLRTRMFLNLMQQDVAFYDAHVSGELSSRLINDSGQLQGLAQFTTQQLLQAVVRLVGALFLAVTPAWIFRCLVRLLCSANRSGHRWHWKGFFPV